MKAYGPGGATDSGRPESWIRLAPVAVFLLLGLLALREIGSLDAGFHLRAGEQILDGAGWPRTDRFTYTVGDRPYIDTSWGYQVVLATLMRGLGPAALTWFHCALVLLTFWLVWITIRLRPADPVVSLLLLLLGGLAAEQRYQVRPELWSYALLAALLYLLHRRAEGRRAPLWLLPLLFLVWANSHSLFVLGWVALAACLAGTLLRERRLDRPLAAWSAAAVAVALVNPYGWRALLFPFTLTTRFQEENVFARSIGEFTSPFALGLSDAFPFYPRVPIWSFRLLFVVVVLSLVPLVRRRRWWSALLALPFLYLSFKMVRNIPLVAVTCLPGAAWALSSTGEPSRRGSWRRLVAPALAGTALVVMAVIGLRVINDAYYIASRRVDRFGFGWNRLALPVSAGEWAERSGIEGPVLNHLGFGGYLMWARPAPVFIDGRLEVMGEAFYRTYRSCLDSSEGLEACVLRFGIRWMIFPYKTNPRLLSRLSGDSRWLLAYVDPMAVVFVRAGPGSGRLVDDTARRAASAPAGAVRLDTLPGLGPTPRGSRAGRWLAGLVRRERFPSEAFGLGLFHYFRGDPARAAPRFADGIARSAGAYYEIYNNLGSALYRLGRGADAAACYRIVLEDDPGNALARERLAAIAAGSRSD